ncbi:FecR/PupR family sigma factor regulator [Vreelandella titanicae]|uniref:FecR/PupR family sigma factor regulator n=1 Tax=Vreelandella titanicae TaxID=664683 RepID=UPI003805C09C
MDNDSGDDAVWQTALDWLMREHEKTLSDADREALHAWLAASSQHRRVFREAEQLWLLTGMIPRSDERN